MHRIGRFVFQGLVWPFPVVDQHRFIHHFHCVRQIFRAMQQEFGLQYPIYSLCESILVAVIAVGH